MQAVEDVAANTTGLSIVEFGMKSRSRFLSDAFFELEDQKQCSDGWKSSWKGWWPKRRPERRRHRQRQRKEMLSGKNGERKKELSCRRRKQGNVSSSHIPRRLERCTDKKNGNGRPKNWT